MLDSAFTKIILLCSWKTFNSPIPLSTQVYKYVQQSGKFNSGTNPVMASMASKLEEDWK